MIRVHLEAMDTNEKILMFELPTALIVRNNALRKNHSWHPLRLVWKLFSPFPRLVWVSNGSSQPSTAFPWIWDHSNQRSPSPTSFFTHHVHLHDVQFYWPYCLHHHRRSIRPVSSIVSPSAAATSVATSTSVTMETLGFIPTQHDPFPFPFYFPFIFPTIWDRE